MLNKFIALFEKNKKYPEHLYDLNLIFKSGLFDKDWYLTNNPDVAQAKMDPLLHYLKNGGFEGRDPGPNFCSAFYLDKYQDVKQSGMNPLVHFLKYGRAEGRQAQPERKNSRGLGKQKIFCVGLNKTGTTSIERALMDFGYKLGIQVEAASLFDDWAVRDFRRIVQFCETAEAFQDVPFSLDFTYQILDYAFPGSKFILTVRNSADEWCQSMFRFYSQIIGVKGIPTVDDMINFPSPHGKGWLWRVQQQVYGVDALNVYDPQKYMQYYLDHNRQVQEYFKFRPNDLLILNLSDLLAMQSLCKFLDIQYTGQKMPHLNRSANSGGG